MDLAVTARVGAVKDRLISLGTWLNLVSKIPVVMTGAIYSSRRGDDR